MSEDQGTPSGGAAAASADAQANATAGADEIKNLKAEMNRKLGNLEQTNAQLINMMQSLAKPAPAATTQSKKLGDVLFDNPDEAARLIKEEAKAELREELNKANQVQTRTQSTIASLVSEFPELGDSNSEFSKRAVAIYHSYAPEDQANPISLKAAVKEAALEMNVKPKSKRNAESDDSFALGGGSGGETRPSRRSREQELDPATIEFARHLGQNVDDPKYMERLKKSAKRRNWSRYE
jgi:hypothetical protein